MMAGAKAHYDGIVAFSQTDFTEGLKKITVPVLVMARVAYFDAGTPDQVELRLWPLLFVFAWSSVFFNLDPVYDWATRAADEISPHPNDTPRLDWRAAQAAGERLMAEQAALHGFTVKRPAALGYIPEFGAYTYAAQGSRGVRERGWKTSLMLDGDTGALRSQDLPTGEHSGNTASWLWALHFADVYGLLPYRIFVFVLGLF
jgi:hypothetical protein